MAITSGFKSQFCDIFSSASGVELEKESFKYTELLGLLDQYEEGIYSDWCNGLEKTCLVNLNQPPISRNTSDLISVNFNPKVIDIMSLQTRKLSVGKYPPMLNN